MCGIAGIIDLSGSRPIPPGIFRMADAIVHRGPDEDGYLDEPGVGLANRRLSIVGLFDGKQPIWNEDRSVVCVFNGEFFDYPEVKARLEAKGHRFRTHCDTELIPHLWEDHQEKMFEHLKGQFAIALWDRKRHCVILARDQFGICPLFYSVQGDWLLFGSEIKAILASGMVDARPDLRGIDQAFNFFAVPGPATCFAGVTLLQPGQYLRIQLPVGNRPAKIERKFYWQIDFPDQGHEEHGRDPKPLVDEFERVLLGAVERRLRADVPVVSYLSGGIDSSIVVAMAAKFAARRSRLSPSRSWLRTSTRLRKPPSSPGTSVRRPWSCRSATPRCSKAIRSSSAPPKFPSSTQAAPPSCGLPAVHQHGFKVALTGEGSDEWLAGYAWFKVHRLLGMFDWMPGITPSYWLRRLAIAHHGRSPGAVQRFNLIRETLGDYTAFQDIYGIMGQSRLRFFSPQTLEPHSATIIRIWNWSRTSSA